MSDDRVSAPTFCSSEYATRFGWRGTMSFKSPKWTQRGQRIAAQETIIVGGEIESAPDFVSRSTVYEDGSKQSLIVESSLASVLVNKSLLDLVAQRRTTGVVGEVLDCLVDGNRQSHRLFDFLGATPGMVRAAFESLVEALQDVVAPADPDTDGLTAVVCHAPSQTCKGLKPAEGVTGAGRIA